MNFSVFDHQCMAEAMRLAQRGLNTTHPNPRVGCVIARDKAIVGRGWHRAAGEAHAEIVALQEAGELATDSTVFVNLEPCAHHGRTPPCARALIDAAVSRVVIAVKDPNPEVNGSGMRMLREAGIECETGLLELPSSELNQGFISRMRTGRPWIRVKLAQSMDGRTALADGASQWITGEAARLDVQHWRARSSAIVTGIGTILADDPSLNVRLGDGCRQPVRVILDSHWRTPPSARILKISGTVLVMGREDVEVPAGLASSGAELVVLPVGVTGVSIEALLDELGRREMNEVHVEAGARLCGALLDARAVDEILLYQAPCLLGSGARAAFDSRQLANMNERLEFEWLESVMTGSDLRLRLKPLYGTR